MPLTLTEAQTQLDAWLAASTAASRNQSYTINGRSLSRTDAAEIRRMIEFWRGEVTRLTGTRSGGVRVRRVTPV